MILRDQSSLSSKIIFVGVLLLCVFLGKAIAVVPFVPLIIMASIILFLFGFVYTEKAMYLLIIAMLLSPEFSMGAVSNQRSIVIRIDDLLIVVFCLAWLARTTLTKNKRIIKRTPLNRLILIYSLILFISTFKSMILGSVQPVRGLFYVFKYIEYYMVFQLATGVIEDKKQVINYIKTFLVVFMIVNIFACTQIGQDRVSAPFEGKEGEPNTLGGYQVLILAIVISLIMHLRSMKSRVILIGIALFTMLPFAFTLSRASYAAIIPMYFTLIIFHRGRARNYLIGFMMIVIILGIFFLPSAVKERIQYTFGGEVDESVVPIKVGDVTLDPSASARINDWIRLYEMWRKRPFFGYGVTGAGFVDSQYFLTLVETGLIGLASFLALLWGIFRHSLRIFRNTKDEFLKAIALGFVAGHAGMVVHALTANTFIVIRIMEPYWFLAAIVMMIPAIEKQKQLPVTELETKKEYVTNASLLLKNGKYHSA